MTEKARIPAIRFKGFTDPWEQRKFADVFDYERPDKYIVSSDKYDDSNDTPVLTANKGFILGYTSEKKTYSKPCIIFDDFTLDCKYVDFKFMVKSSAMKILTAKIGINLIFAFERLNTAKIENLGHARHYISVVQPTETLVPEIEEQDRLAMIFSNLDNLITLHQRKYEKLVNIKKSLLEKMFPSGDEKVPKIRFKGFTDPWEQRKVGELLEERNSQAPKSKEYPLMAFIANEGVTEKGERYDRSSLVSDVENKLYKRTEKGDFIYSSNNLETGSIGLNRYGKACISPVYSIFYPTEIANAYFIGHRFIRKDFINEMIKWRQGVIYGQWRIHEADFIKIEISAPSLHEQELIGEILEKLDNLITLHQRKKIFIRRNKYG